MGRVPSATLNWKLVGVVLGSKISRVRNPKSWGKISFYLAYLPVAGHNFQLAIVSSEWDVESDNSLACHNQVQPLLVNAGLGGTGLIEKLDLLKEAWLTVCIKSLIFLSDCSRELAGSLQD